MAIKDSVTSWFIQNIILPNAEDIRNPGYVLSKFTEKGQTIQLREFFFPERFYSELEDRIVRRMGERGERKLYSIGKRFGYRYAMISRYDKAGRLGKKKFEEFMYLFTRYIEVVYAKKLKHAMKLEKKMLELTADSYVGCELNGKGYLLMIGAWTGGWAFLNDDKLIEGVQVSCQGRGDKECRLVCAPIGYLKGIGLKPIPETDMSSLEMDYQKYSALNKVFPTAYDNHSLKSLIENRVFTYKSGRLFFGKERLVGIEASMYYLLDNGLSADEGTKKILYETAFEIGRELGNGKDALFVQRFLSALGFGDVQVVGKNVLFSHFPWTRFSEKCSFTILSGFASGLLGGAKKIELSKITKYESGDGFHVKIG